MSDGFKLLPVLIGLFAINQVLRELLGLAGKPEELGGQSERSMPRVGDWFRQVGNMLRSSCIGTWVGILPGAGANVGSVLAYSAAKGMSKQSDKFGTGCDEGVVASESANNATVGGALIPLVAMGIPGSLIDAILLGAFVLHGLQPGPLLFFKTIPKLWTRFWVLPWWPIYLCSQSCSGWRVGLLSWPLLQEQCFSQW